MLRFHGFCMRSGFFALVCSKGKVCLFLQLRYIKNTMDTTELYQHIIMDHYRHPRNRGRLAAPAFITEMLNPSCGDAVSLQAQVRDNIIIALMFEGKGCVISQAAASLLTEYACNKALVELLAMTKDDMLKLVGMQLGPLRLRCALLPLEALQQGIESYAQSSKTLS